MLLSGKVWVMAENMLAFNRDMSLCPQFWSKKSSRYFRRQDGSFCFQAAFGSCLCSPCHWKSFFSPKVLLVFDVDAFTVGVKAVGHTIIAVKSSPSSSSFIKKKHTHTPHFSSVMQKVCVIYNMKNWTVEKISFFITYFNQHILSEWHCFNVYFGYQRNSHLEICLKAKILSKDIALLCSFVSISVKLFL